MREMRGSQHIKKRMCAHSYAAHYRNAAGLMEICTGYVELDSALLSFVNDMIQLGLFENANANEHKKVEVRVGLRREGAAAMLTDPPAPLRSFTFCKLTSSRSSD